MKNSVKAVLKAGKNKIEQGWCQETAALNSELQIVAPNDPEACYWCMFGAVLSADDFYADKECKAALIMLSNALDHPTDRYIDAFDFVTKWNDIPGREQQEVLAVFDKAIEQ